MKIFILICLFFLMSCGSEITNVTVEDSTIPPEEAYIFCENNTLDILENLKLEDCTSGDTCDSKVIRVFGECYRSITKTKWKYNGVQSCQLIYVFFDYDYEFTITTICNENGTVFDIFKKE